MTNSIQLTQGEVTLKHLTLDVTTTLYSIVEKHRDELGKWLPFVAFMQNVLDAEEYIQQLIDLTYDGSTEVFSVFHHSEWVGMVVLKDMDWYTQKTELGYWIHPEFQNRGIATTALKLVIEYCFEELSMHRLQIKVATGNKPSLALVRKFPFKQEGVERDSEKVNNQFFDLAVFGCLKSDY
ncbi:N-acetyltransferase [Prolixibacteraceae bacterium JC049]|nr:N-acetyltransferase [Prolixibacteraceae bacterium JC049]